MSRHVYTRRQTFTATSISLLAGLLAACGGAPAIIDAPEPVAVRTAPTMAAPSERPETAQSADARLSVSTTRTRLDRAAEAGVDREALALYAMAEADWRGARDALEDARYAYAIELSTRAQSALAEAQRFAAPRLRARAAEAFTSTRVESLMSELLPVAVPIYAEDEVFVSLDSVFVPDSDRVRSSAKARIAELARVIAEHPTFVVTLEARADDALSPTRRMNLSATRAVKVRSMLAELGAPSRQLRSRGRGVAKPSLPGKPDRSARLDVRFDPRPVEIVASRR